MTGWANQEYKKTMTLVLGSTNPITLAIIIIEPCYKHNQEYKHVSDRVVLLAATDPLLQLLKWEPIIF